MDDHPTSIAVVGGAVAGLAAAERLRHLGDVTLFERQSYADKRVNCGEAINDATLIPLEKTRENGFLNDVAGFTLHVFRATSRRPGEGPLASATLRCEPGFITDRNVVERRWAVRLRDRGVDVREGTALTPEAYRRVCDEYDCVVDATGQPSLTVRTFDEREAYTGDMVAINADVTGDFAESLSHPQILFEGYVGYAWVFPKTRHRANVGIGWAGDQRPDDYYRAFETTCRRNDIPVPERDAMNIYTIPRGPSLSPEATHRPAENVFLVGDAAGIANRYQGEGICQGIRSSYLLAELLRRGEGRTYPRRLYRTMKHEYRLAHLMRGAWVEHEDPHLLAGVAKALDGLTIDDVTRSPRRVVARVVRRPRVAARLVADRGMLRRFVDAYTDRWEYSPSRRA
jgi:digeranylgeranylglycerophospholipid reductase